MTERLSIERRTARVASTWGRTRPDLRTVEKERGELVRTAEGYWIREAKEK